MFTVQQTQPLRREIVASMGGRSCRYGVFARALIVEQILLFSHRTNGLPKLTIIRELFPTCPLKPEQCNKCKEQIEVIDPFGTPVCFGVFLKGMTDAVVTLESIDNVWSLTSKKPWDVQALHLEALAWRAKNPFLFLHAVEQVKRYSFPYLREK